MGNYFLAGQNSTVWFLSSVLWRRMGIQRSMRLWSLCQCEELRRNEELDEGFGLQGAQWGTLNHPWHEDTDSGSPLIPAATTQFCIPPLLPFLLSFQDLISSLFQPWAVQSLTAQSESLHVFVLVHVHHSIHTFHVFYHISPVPSTSYLGNMKLNSGRSDDIDEQIPMETADYTQKLKGSPRFIRKHKPIHCFPLSQAVLAGRNKK